MTIQEACQRLGKSESTIRRWIRAGKLTAEKDNGINQIPDEEVDAIVSAMADDRSMTGQVTGQDELINQLKSEIIELQIDNRYLREELRKKDQVVAVAQNTAQQLIERLQTPFWKRWFRRQKALPVGDVVDMEPEDTEVE